MLIHCIGDASHGMGHVIRCLTLARQLRVMGERVEFVTPPNTPGFTRILADGFGINARTDYRADDALGHDTIIIDLEHGPDINFLGHARDHYKTVVNIGGVGWPQDLLKLSDFCDLEIYQSILIDHPPAARRLQGVDYIIIRPDYAECVPNPAGHAVICFGGSDPHNLTRKASAALPKGLAAHVVYGPAAGNDNAPPNLLKHLAGAALFIGQTGMLAYEAAAAGVPSILYNLSPDHERTALELERRGCAWSAGQCADFAAQDLHDRVTHLLRDVDHRARMSAAGKDLVDGGGVARVAEKIQEMTQ